MSRTWPRPTPRHPASTAVVYLARGRDAGHAEAAERFLASYERYQAGVPHDLVLLCKGFDAAAEQAAVEATFGRLASQVLTLPDEGFDIGAYRAAADRLGHERVCCLNGWSEILAPDWLLKLTLNLERPGIGIVGCSGAYEVMRLDRRFGPFPNPHLRSNAFLIGRRLFLDAIADRPIRAKLDAFLAESGPQSITREVLRRGLGALIVGRDGRGYPPRFWPRSRTFRLGTGDNVLVGDNQTRAASGYSSRVLASVQIATWGTYLRKLPPAGIGAPASAAEAAQQDPAHHA